MRGTKARRHDRTKGAAVSCFVPLALLSPISVALCMANAGCADTNRQPTSRPASVNEQQDQALRDPFNYGPKEKDKYIDENMPSVTGGSTGHFDKKAFDRDVNRVFNP
jgi:hypothetical protein